MTTSWNTESWTVHELRRALADGALQPTELVEQTLARSNQNAGRNTYLWQNASWTRAEAKRVESIPRSIGGPFGDGRSALWGLPISVKDCFDLAGAPTTCGTVFYRDLKGIAANDSWLVEHFAPLVQSSQAKRMCIRLPTASPAKIPSSAIACYPAIQARLPAAHQAVQSPVCLRARPLLPSAPIQAVPCAYLHRLAAWLATDPRLVEAIGAVVRILPNRSTRLAGCFVISKMRPCSPVFTLLTFQLPQSHSIGSQSLPTAYLRTASLRS